jgi:hypothetical protein
MGTGGSFPGGKPRPGRDTDHSPPSSSKVIMSRSSNSSPPCRLHGGCGTALLYFNDFTFVTSNRNEVSSLVADEPEHVQDVLRSYNTRDVMSYIACVALVAD